MARILVPLDESPLAEESLPWAAAFAHAQGLAIHLIAVRPSDEAFWEFAELDPSGPVQQAADSLPAYLAAVAARPPLAGLPVTTEVRTGDIVEQVLIAAKRGETNYVVITTRGRGGFGLPGPGNVADKLVRTLPVPVVVVPPGAAPTALEGVLVSLDGSKAAEMALAPARRLAKAAGAKLHLLRVIDPAVDWRLSEADFDTFLDHLTERAGAYLSAVAEPGEVTIVLRGDPVDIILEYAHGNRCQVIAMATHGWSGPVRLELGSTTDAVVASSVRPVLVVRAPADTA
jgi:nucleotide-binding universal stress UspA family protein